MAENIPLDSGVGTLGRIDFGDADLGTGFAGFEALNGLGVVALPVTCGNGDPEGVVLAAEKGFGVGFRTWFEIAKGFGAGT